MHLSIAIETRRADERVTAAGLVRPLRASDYDLGFLEALSALRPTELSRERFEQICAALGDNCHLWVIERVGRVAESGSLLVEQKFIHAGGRVGHVEDVAVHPAWQGHGLGRVLMEALLADARRAGCYKVILDCDEHVARFYESLGFHRHGLLMRLDLTPAP
jgi:glucosamine-phosphate N-acetyltransferase